MTVLEQPDVFGVTHTVAANGKPLSRGVYRDGFKFCPKCGAKCSKEATTCRPCADQLVTLRRKPLADRLWAKVEKTDGCWLWLGGTHEGYGQIGEGGRHGRSLRVHRVAYELLVGPIPEGLTLDHLCRVRICCNPRHLEPVTRRENNMRGLGVGAIAATKTHCPWGHPYEGHHLYVDPSGSRKCRTCRNERKAARKAGILWPIR